MVADQLQESDPHEADQARPDCPDPDSERHLC
jgi:hypothetical protein